MEFTSKQERNGAAEGVAAHDSAVPGADVSAQLAGLMSASKASADAWMAAGHSITSGDGVAGNGAGGNMWDWDDKLAVAEQPGEQ